MCSEEVVVLCSVEVEALCFEVEVVWSFEVGEVYCLVLELGSKTLRAPVQQNPHLEGKQTTVA